MNILLLEDNLYTAEMIKEDIENFMREMNVTVEVFACNSIYEANDAIQLYNFNYIISDLNLNPEGLDECYWGETLGAVITGWVWIKHMYLDDNNENRIIFYTAFSEELLHNDEYIKNYKDIIPLIPKTKNGDNISELCQILIEKFRKNGEVF